MAVKKPLARTWRSFGKARRRASLAKKLASGSGRAAHYRQRDEKIMPFMTLPLVGKPG
jgi:hypothetical protein